MHLDIDGSFSGRFFSGDYKLKFIDGQGPWQATSDTINVTINGNTEMDLEVTPYYMVRNPQFSAAGNTINGNVAIEKVITGANGRDIEFARLYINDGQFVSDNGDYNIAQVDASTISDTSISGSVSIPDGYNKNSIFARMGIKIVGVEDLVFSEVVKVDL